MGTPAVTLDFSKAMPITGATPAPTANALQGAVSYATQQNPDHYAKLLRFQKLTGVPPVVSNGNEPQLQQAADLNSLNAPQFAAANPRTTAWASNPDNAAVSGVDELHRLAGIEQNATMMRAYTPSLGDKIGDKLLGLGSWMMGGTISKDQLRQNFWQNPAVRIPADTASAMVNMAGNVGAFVGWHGDAGRPNLLQRIAAHIDPANAGIYSEGQPDDGEFDQAAKFAGPLVAGGAAGVALKGAGLAAGLSETAATVLSGLGVGALFTADQGGQTYSSVAGAGGSDYDARLAANRVAAINALPNALFGATELPWLKRFPLLASLGIGGATGASGQLSQNVVTGRPWSEGVLSSAAQGAAMQGGMHLGFGAFAGSPEAGAPAAAAVPEEFAAEFKGSPFLSNLAGAVSATEGSALRERAPDKFYEANLGNFEGDASLRVPAEQFSAYFKAKGVDPADVAKGLGSTNYPEALLSGGDVEMPPADFLAKLEPEHQRALLPDVVDPGTGLTARQHQEGRAELQQWASPENLARLNAQMDAADAETAATPEYSQVKEQLRQRYADAGETPEVAETLATKDANAYSNLARNVGMKPSELLSLYNPKVVSGEAPGGAIAHVPLNEESEHPITFKAPENVAKPEIDGRDGKATTLLTSARELPAKYRLVEADKLVPSHDAQTFAKNPAYPEGLQERAYDTSKEAQARVIQQAQNYDSRYTVNTNPDAVNGPPVVTPDGTVLGGNSRAMSTQRLYEADGSAYKAALKEQAATYGFTPEQVEEMKRPVLVRQVESPATADDARRLGSELNKSMTGAMGVAERAVSAGKNIKPDTLRSVANMMQDDTTLREAMARHGAEIVKMLTADGVITERERPQFVDDATGGLSEEGKTFVERALLGSVIDDPRLMDSAPKAVLNKLERSLGSITSFASRPDEWNLLPAIREAVGELGAIQRSGSTVDLQLGQTSMFGEERNPLVDAMIRALDGKPNAVRAAFESFAKDSDENMPGQARMFGEAKAVDAFNHAFGSKLSEQEYHDGLRTAAVKAPDTAGRADAQRDEGVSGGAPGKAAPGSQRSSAKGAAGASDPLYQNGVATVNRDFDGSINGRADGSFVVRAGGKSLAWARYDAEGKMIDVGTIGSTKPSEEQQQQFNEVAAHAVQSFDGPPVRLLRYSDARTIEDLQKEANKPRSIDWGTGQKFAGLVAALHEDETYRPYGIRLTNPAFEDRSAETPKGLAAYIQSQGVGKDRTMHEFTVPRRSLMDYSTREYGSETQRRMLADGVLIAPGTKLTPFDASGLSLLHQLSPADGARGWFRVLPDGSYEIGKTKIGDLSTFVHEPAHAYLKIIGDLARRGDASETLKGDYQKILDYLGAKDGQPFTREQQETWARANEQYLREGHAPSPGLKGAFQRFAIWLGSVYKKASDLGVHLSDDIRGVFDRLYAAEDGVNKAAGEAGPKLFRSAEEAGWTEEQFRQYAEQNSMSLEQAKSNILGMLNEAAVREKAEAWRNEEQNVRTAVTEQVDASPEYTAIRSLRRGALDDGTELTMSRDALVQQFGEERVKQLQKQHPGLYRNEGGVEPETAAEILGFDSAADMLQQLEASPRRSEVIEKGTRYYMTEKHGDIRYDGTLDDQARLALENDRKSDSLHAELSTLKQRVADLQAATSGRQDAMRSIEVAPIASYREAAHQMIEAKAVADLQPGRYLDASRKYSREAFDALRRGDANAAAEAKHKELLNHFLFREATNAQEYIARFESYAKRMQSKGVQAKIGQAGSDYREQFNHLLFRYGIGGPPAEAPARTLFEWADALYDAGKETAVDPSLFDESRSKPYRQASVAEVRTLHDALINIRHLAAQELEMTVNGRKIEFSAAMERMNAQARQSIQATPRPVFDDNRAAGQKVGDLVDRGTALLKRTEFLMKQLDGGTSGPWHDNLWHLAADSQGREDALNAEVTKAVGDALQNMPKEQRMRLLDKVTIDGISEPVTRRSMLAMAFNMGNEGNLDRLQKTFLSHGWDPHAIEQIKGMLTREEWTFVQGAWDSLKPLGQAQAELEKRLTGLPPVMVKPTPLQVELADGSKLDLAGGYYPIVMDPKFSTRGAQADAGMTAQNLMETGYGRAATSRGNMKERTGFGGPLLMDYEQVLTQHTAKVIKDISHREFMLTANKLLLDPGIRQTLRETVGVGSEAQMMPWLRTIINNANGSSVQGLGDVSRAMTALRTNVVKAALGFKFSTLLLQLTHASSVFLHTSPMSYAQAMVDFLAHPKEMSEQIKGLSPNEMASRGDNLDRDMRKVLRDGVGKTSVGDLWARAGMMPVQLMDHVLSFPLWMSVYRDSLAANAHLEESEARYQAMQKADGAVRMGLGSNAPKDLAPIMRNHDLTKLLTTMGGFHNLKYNQMADVVNQFKSSGGVGRLTYGMLMAGIIPAVMGPLITGRGPKDDENAGAWAAKRALLFPAETVAILNIAVEAMENHGDMRYSPIASMAERTAKDGAHATSDSEDKDWTGMGLNTLQTAMEGMGVSGTDQAFKIGRYARQAQQGKIEDPNPWDAVAGGPAHH